VGLDYEDPRFKPFEAFQQFKNHPSIKPLLDGGDIISAGARTIAAGGWQSLPTLEMPGALLIGDAGGNVNVPKIKASTRRSVPVCSPRTLRRVREERGLRCEWRASAGGQELKKVRNIKPGFKRGLCSGWPNAGLETVTLGKLPWPQELSGLRGHRAARRLRIAGSRWTVSTLPPRDRLASVFFAATTHDEAQPAHLHVADTNICATRCAQEFGNPCTNFCPANVYEMVDDGSAASGCRSTRRIACIASLRHQGSLPDHQLGHAGRRLRSQLPEPLGSSRAPVTAATLAEALRGMDRPRQDRGRFCAAARRRAPGRIARRTHRHPRRYRILAAPPHPLDAKHATLRRRVAFISGAASGAARRSSWICSSTR